MTVCRLLPRARAPNSDGALHHRTHRWAYTSDHGRPRARTRGSRPRSLRRFRSYAKGSAPPGSGRSLLLLVAQFAAQDFSDIGLRQIGPELDLLGDLVGGELRAAIFDHLFCGEVRVLLDDEGLDRLARSGVLDADHRAFQHARMARDHFLDLVRIDVEARDQDHVLLAVHDLGVTLRVHHADVAGAEIAVRGHHLCGLVRPVPVTRHHLRTLGADFAGLAERHFVA